MHCRIVIVGATGTLGDKLIKYCHKKLISIESITYFNNYKKANLYKKKYNIKKCFCLNNTDDKNNFLKYLSSNSIDLIYFLDYGSGSLNYAYQFLRRNSNSIIAIANKEMLLAGGRILINYIQKTSNKLIPLDSEHFSLINSLTDTNFISKIYITASGGPFYFKKNVDINFVNIKNVIKHPKWKMGINNSIDSSNFINKLLEIYELHHIFDIPLDKIDFLISREAFIHSIIEYNSGILTFNSFKNDMIIPLTYPLRSYIKVDEIR